jgi:hypothetical protein
VFVTGAGFKARAISAKYNIFPLIITIVGYVIGQQM